MSISVVLRLVPSALAEGRLAGEAEVVGTGRRGVIRDAAELIAFVLEAQSDISEKSPGPRLDPRVTRSKESLMSAGLTSRQADVLLCVARGMTNAQIARELGLREHTVKKHLEHIYQRLGVQARSAAVATTFAIKEGT